MVVAVPPALAARVATAADLRRLPLLCDVDAEMLASLAAVTRRHVYAATQPVVETGPVRGAMFLIACGRVRVTRLSLEGAVTTLLLLGPGELFEFLGRAPDGTPHSQATALDAQTVVYELPAHRVLELFAANPRLAVAALAQVGSHLVALCDRVEDLAYYSVRKRLARTLARQAGTGSQPVVWETRAELAALIGTREEKVSKELKALRTLGLIDYRPHRQGIRVCDPAALMQV